MEKYFIDVNGCSLFYRKAGSGPLLLLLHPSPRSSKMMEPLARLLAQHYTVICADTPGYGLSEPLPQPPASIYDYVPAIDALLNELTSAPAHIYGTATGAQLGIAYALRHPQKMAHLYLDNAAHFNETECSEILANYFPDLAPQSDGSHLQRIWQLVCDSCLYFPWYKKEAQYRIAGSLPPLPVLNEIAKDYLAAGAGYATAYIAAFTHERAEKVQQLTCSTTIFRWMGSPLLKYINQLLAYPMPQNISVTETPEAMAERYSSMAAYMTAAVK
jgi:pimeloyl-ACP methyl ester carboxylesterase